MSEHHRRLQRKLRKSLIKSEGSNSNPMSTILDTLAEFNQEVESSSLEEIGESSQSSLEDRAPSPTGSDDSSDTITAATEKRAETSSVKDLVYDIYKKTRNK